MAELSEGQLGGNGEMPDVAVVLDDQRVTPGEIVTGSVFVNYEGPARRLTIALVNREDFGVGGSIDREIDREVVVTPDGLEAGQRFPFSFALPLEATPRFRGPSLGLAYGKQSSGDRMWGVSAEIDRWGLDHKAFAGLEVVPFPPETAVMSLVMPHEIEQMQRDPDRGINTAQQSRRWFSGGAGVNPADGIGIRCDPPAARQGQAVLVDVNLPPDLGSSFSIGLFAYESYWVRAGESRSVQKFREVWSESLPIPGPGVHRMVLRVPSAQPPTYKGLRLSTWWDVRPCFGPGTSEPSQRSSQPVIVRP